MNKLLLKVLEEAKQLNHLNHVVTSHEAAEMMNLTERHVRRLCATGALTCRLAGKVWLILKSSVESYEGGRWK